MIALRNLPFALAATVVAGTCSAEAIGTPSCSATTSTVQAERSHYRQKLVPVATDVKLEVLDWGGRGRPLVLLSGLGNTAHVFDTLAPGLTEEFHVYGITRRGFGASSAPKDGYTANRLGDDVIAVLDALDIDRPIVAGHSIAGEELSAIGQRHGARVAGLVYLDATHEYAIYDPTRHAYLPDLRRVDAQMARMHEDPLDKQQMATLLTEVTALRQSLAHELDAIGTDEASTVGAAHSAPGAAGMASFSAFRCFVSGQLGGLIPEDEVRQSFSATPAGGVGEPTTPPFVYNAILAGEDRYSAPAVPILAIVPVPRALDLPVGSDPAKRRAAETMHNQMQEAEIVTLKRQNPTAQVVRIPHGHHYVFLSNPSEVSAAIVAFARTLPSAKNRSDR